MKNRRMQGSQFGCVSTWVSGGHLEVPLRPWQIHHYLETELGFIGQASKRIRRWVFCLRNCHLTRFESREVLRCSINHSDHITIRPALDTPYQRRPGFGPGLNARKLWKQAANNISGCWEFPVVAHSNNAWLESSLPMGKCWPASLRSARSPGNGATDPNGSPWSMRNEPMRRHHQHPADQARPALVSHRLWPPWRGNGFLCPRLPGRGR